MFHSKTGIERFNAYQLGFSVLHYSRVLTMLLKAEPNV